MQSASARPTVRVLIVDDNINLVESARRLLEISGATVSVAASAAQARGHLAGGGYDLAFVDLMLPDGSGLDLAREFRGETRFVMMTGHPRLMDAARRAAPRAAGFLPKPFSAEQLVHTFQRALPDFSGARADNGESKTIASDPFAGWIGSSEAIARLKRQIAAVAPLSTTVFLLGESGTGKELAAESVHRASGREGPFLSLNCGAIPDTLLANELFGHEKGSYTGASRAEPGLFERANGGTVFLDEVTELPLEHQPHLLRVLETQRVTRIGGGKPVPVDVRVVAASNRVDTPLVRDRVLREDLFYRLMVFPILLPPLRERLEDIPEFVEQILGDWNEEHGTAVTCADTVLAGLQHHDWPGNVRELKHAVQRLAILSDGEIVDPPDFLTGLSGNSSGPGVPVGTSIRELERRLILATLDHYQGDRGRTADTLGISQKTLYNRLKAYERDQVDPESLAS